MKAIFVALAVFIAGATALPQNERYAALDKNSERIIDDLLVSVIQELRQSIRDRGLDPYYLGYAEASYALPVAAIFSAAASAESVQMDGLSNIVVNQISYGLISGILTYDLSLPQLNGAVGSADAEVIVFGNKITGTGSGSAVATDFRVTGSAHVSVSIIQGITVSNIQVVVSLGSLQSDVTLVVQDYDLSDYVNTLISEIIPYIIEDSKDDIGELIAILLENYINRIL